MQRSVLLGTTLAAAMLAATAANAATMMLSVGASSLCGPSSCFSESQRTFQQTWSAREFGTSAAISRLLLDRSLIGAMQDYAVRVTFQDASGETVANWGAFTIAVLSGQQVALGGQTLDWDATRGDLTLRLEVLIPDRGGVGGGGFGGGGFGGGGFGGGLAAFGDDGGSDMSLDTRGAIGGDIAARDLMPAVVEPSLIAVPEPAAWALMLLGFMGAGAAVRTRRAALLKV